MTTARLLDVDDNLIDTRVAMVTAGAAAVAEGPGDSPGAHLADAHGISVVTSPKEVVALLDGD